MIELLDFSFNILLEFGNDLSKINKVNTFEIYNWF